MPYKAQILCTCILLLASHFGMAQPHLVKDGKALATIVIADSADESIHRAAFDFQYHIKKSTGAILPIQIDRTVTVSKNGVYLFIGASKLTGPFAEKASALQPDEFLIHSNDKQLFILGHPQAKLPVLHYGVSYLLERLLDAKWFFPGDFGTSVQQLQDIALPIIDIAWRPSIAMRLFGHSRDIDDSTKLWLIHHRLGAIDTLNYPHGFKDWYPDLLPYVSIKPFDPKRPKKKQQREYREQYVKFRMNDPGLRAAVVKQWVKQGKPPVYNLSLPDGHGYDSSLIPAAEPRALWAGEVDVTTPYLQFCESIDQSINAGRRESLLYILAYAAYHRFPVGYDFDGDNFIVAYVSYSLDQTDRENWERWNATGATMILRPNWWHKGHFTSYAPYKREIEFVNYAKQNGMQGFFMDILRRQWAAQGFQYYAIARLSYTNLTYEQVRKEYLSFFGSYATQVDQYLSASETLYFERLVTSEGKHKYPVKDGKFQEFVNLYYPDEMNQLGQLVNVANSQKSNLVFFKRMQWLKSGHELAQSLLNYYKVNSSNPSAKRTIDLIGEIRENSKRFPYSYDAEYVIKKYVLPFEHAKYSRTDYNKSLRAERKQKKRKRVKASVENFDELEKD